MFNADQARALVDYTSYKDDDFIDVHSVLDLIKVHAIMGDEYLVTDCAISDAVKEQLEDLGFEVSEEGNYSVVSWG